MAAVHAAMHDCEAPGSLPDLRDQQRARIEMATPLPDHTRGAVLDLLDTLPSGDRLCHGDLHLGNILGSWDEPVVIDWGEAARGDAAADVARTVLLHRFGVPPPGAPLLVRKLAGIGRRVIAARYLTAYQRSHALEDGAVNRWLIVRAATASQGADPGGAPCAPPIRRSGASRLRGRWRANRAHRVAPQRKLLGETLDVDGVGTGDDAAARCGAGRRLLHGPSHRGQLIGAELGEPFLAEVQAAPHHAGSGPAQRKLSGGPPQLQVFVNKRLMQVLSVSGCAQPPAMAARSSGVSSASRSRRS